MTVTNTLITSYKMPLPVTYIRLLMGNIVAEIGANVKTIGLGSLWWITLELFTNKKLAFRLASCPKKTSNEAYLGLTRGCS